MSQDDTPCPYCGHPALKQGKCPKCRTSIPKGRPKPARNPDRDRPLSWSNSIEDFSYADEESQETVERDRADREALDDIFRQLEDS